MTLPVLSLLVENPDEPSAQRYFNRLTFFPPLAAAHVVVAHHRLALARVERLQRGAP